MAEASDPWVEHRSLLFTVAYEILGSAADAEDVVQDAWLRWREVDHDAVDHPRAYLVQVVTRQALNRLRTLARRKETYVGPWLPEPLQTAPDVADDVALADSVSTAMLLVLETLGPVERAVFVLHEVFATPYDEIAAAVGKSPEACRQIASRARKHVAARRPRQEVEEAERRQVLEGFRRATSAGDLQGLIDLLAPDVVLLTDAGGAKQAALRPIEGLDKVLRFLTAVLDPGATWEALIVNGGPGLAVTIDGELDSVATFATRDGLITGIYVVRNPAKLTGFADQVALSR